MSTGDTAINLHANRSSFIYQTDRFDGGGTSNGSVDKREKHFYLHPPVKPLSTDKTITLLSDRKNLSGLN